MRETDISRGFEIRHRDFQLHIRRSAQGELIAHGSSPAGESTAPIRVPKSVEALSRELGHIIRSASDRNREARSQQGRVEAAAEVRKRLGSALFAALFGGAVGTLFYECLSRAGRTEGLRIQLRFDLTDAEVADLVTLPWEYLYSERRGEFLALQGKTPVVRYVEVPRPVELGALPSRLRILVAVSNPTDVPALDVAAERRKIERALGDSESLDVAFLDQPSRESLAATLREAMRQGRPFHGLHFIGHGGLDSRSGRGVLCFATAEGTSRPVSGEELARELANYPDLRLVFLNACETGKAAPAAQPFGGVAAALVRTGVLAVVAMQQPISDVSAIEFSRVLYEHLVAGDAVDTAVTEARLALDRQPETAGEWGIPVLFLRQPDGRLFELRQQKMGRARMALAASLGAVLAAGALGIGVLSDRFEGPADPCRQETSEEVRRRTGEGARLAEEGQWEPAARSLVAALEADPHFAHAWSTLGAVELERGRFTAARESFTRALEEQPVCPSHNYNLGSFHLSREEFEEARKHLRRALELRPSYPQASAALGRAYLLQGGLEAARQVLEEGLRRVEEDHDTMVPPGALYALHANLGRVALSQGRSAEAVDHLREARTRLPPTDPRWAEAISDLARAHAAAGQPSAACRVLAERLPLGRDPVMPWEESAVALGESLRCEFSIPNLEETS